MSYTEHQPVLLAEVLAHLEPRPGGRYVDGTLGGAGHAEGILRASSPGGWLYGCDRDGEAMMAAERRLAPYTGRFELRQGSYAELGEWVPEGSCDGVLFDLGVSTHQLERAERGFSFQQDGPLDMRFDAGAGTTAAQLVNEADGTTLADWFWQLGGERYSRRIARAIVRQRQTAPFLTTRQLAEAIERVVPRGCRGIHPARRSFQALRIVVNREMETLQLGLRAGWHTLMPRGRLLVITFHSGEDRLVKDFGNALARDYEVVGEVDRPELRRPRKATLRWVCRKAIVPGAVECAQNPQARSAHLRVMEKRDD